MQGRENMEVPALVEFPIWLRTVAQAEMIALMGCRNGSANTLTTFLAPYGVQRRGDAAKHVNKGHYLLLDPPRVHDAQCRLHRRKL